MRTKIEWADRVWNPVTGCTKVSEGCRNCYAERMALRFWGARKFHEVLCHEEKLEEPLHWMIPSRVFVNSMSDLFHPDVTDDFIWNVFSVMAQAEKHTFMILTKRPQRMSDFLCQWENHFPVGRNNSVLHDWPLKNVWLGVSAENQQAADERIPWLLKTPAVVRFVSVEPMLGPVNLEPYFQYPPFHENYKMTWGLSEAIGLDWVICGGETGPDARPMHPDWARGLLDQCLDAGVPFFFKHWGEWVAEYPQGLSLANRKQTYAHNRTFYRVGKTIAGRMLDGREWNEFPVEME